MESLVKISGALMTALALLHAVFPRYFKWEEELRSITLLTRQIHYIHTFFIALTVLLLGLICLTNASDLVATPFGRRVSFGIFIFWFCRLLIQFYGYSPLHWKGKSFETTVHILFALLWAFLSGVFGLVALSR